MAELPQAAEQILQVHAPFLHAVVQVALNRAPPAPLQAMLQEAESRGWTRMVAAVRQVLAGQRDRSLLLGLDEEDRLLLEAVLAGIDNPATLPALDKPPEAAAAAPGLASMIRAASRGDVHAFTALADMATQMVKAGGDMARLGGIVRRLIDGERDESRLCKGMSAQGRKLVRQILEELARDSLH